MRPVHDRFSLRLPMELEGTAPEVQMRRLEDVVEYQLPGLELEPGSIRSAVMRFTSDTTCPDNQPRRVLVRDAVGPPTHRQLNVFLETQRCDVEREGSSSRADDGRVRRGGRRRNRSGHRGESEGHGAYPHARSNDSAVGLVRPERSEGGMSRRTRGIAARTFLVASVPETAPQDTKNGFVRGHPRPTPPAAPPTRAPRAQPCGTRSTPARSGRRSARASSPCAALGRSRPAHRSPP